MAITITIHQAWITQGLVPRGYDMYQYPLISSYNSVRHCCCNECTQITKFMGPTWGPPGSCRSQMGPMLAPWTLLSGLRIVIVWYRPLSPISLIVVSLALGQLHDYPIFSGAKVNNMGNVNALWIDNVHMLYGSYGRDEFNPNAIMTTEDTLLIETKSCISVLNTGLKLENYYFFTFLLFLDLKLENYSVFTFLLFLDLKLENYSVFTF